MFLNSLPKNHLYVNYSLIDIVLNNLKFIN